MAKSRFDELVDEITLEEESQIKDKEKYSMYRDEHYNKYKVQPFDVFKSLGIFEAYCQAAAIKYIMRYRDKDGVRDLRKAASMCNVLATWLDEKEKDAKYHD